MVGTLVGLEWKLTIRQLKSSTVTLVLTIIGGLWLLGASFGAAIGLAALREHPDTRGPITVLVFAVITLAWPLLTVFVTGTSESVDVRQFSLYPVRGRQLIPGLLVAGLIGFGGLFTVLVDIGFVAAWSTTPLGVVLSLVGVVLGTALCVLGQRCVSTAVSGLMRHRRAKDLTMVALFAVILGGSIGFQLISQRLSSGAFGSGGAMAVLTATARVAAWTPFGWPWAAVSSASTGAWGAAAAQLALSVGLIALLAWVWTGQVARALVSPLDPGGTGERIRSGNVFDRLLPDNPAGAIARRDVRYLKRDPRRLMGCVSMVLLPILMLMPTITVSGTSGGLSDDARTAMISIAPALFSWMIGAVVSADICYDGSALGTQILAGVSGRDDRWGRALAMLVVFGAIQVVLVVVFTVWSDRWDMLPGSLGLSLAFLGSGLGIGSWVGSIWQYAQPPPGGNMFGRGATGGAAGMISSVVGLFAPLVVAAPTIALVIIGHFVPALEWAALVVGVATGAIATFVGVRGGGRRLDATWPEVLAKVTWKG